MCVTTGQKASCFSRREFRNREAEFSSTRRMAQVHASVGANSGIVRRSSVSATGTLPGRLQSARIQES